MRTHNVNNIQPIIATNIGKVSAGGWSVFVRKAGDSKRDTSNEALAAASPEAAAKAEFKAQVQAKAGFGIGVERSVASCVSHAGSVRRPRLLLAPRFAVTALLALAPVMEGRDKSISKMTVTNGIGNCIAAYNPSTNIHCGMCTTEAFVLSINLPV